MGMLAGVPGDEADDWTRDQGELGLDDDPGPPAPADERSSTERSGAFKTPPPLGQSPPGRPAPRPGDAPSPPPEVTPSDGGDDGSHDALIDAIGEATAEPVESSQRSPAVAPPATPRDPAGVETEMATAPPAARARPVFEKGRLVFGRYLLEERLGEGGNGEVWKVKEQTLGVRALKVLRPEVALNETSCQRFQREAAIMARINHPNAVKVHRFERGSQVAFIEMELVRGRDLKAIFDAGGRLPMPLSWVTDLLLQLCEVLAAAHDYEDDDTKERRPIVHRDLKLSNLMLDEKMNLKVLDFGIAKMVGDDEGDLTKDHSFIGTYAYASPEQLGGDPTRPIGPSSDLYSVGVILYQLLTGQLPVRYAPRPMNEVAPSAKIPPAVEAVVRRCLEIEPSQRPESATELRRLWEEAITPPDVPTGWRWAPLALPAMAVVIAAGLYYQTVGRGPARVEGGRTAGSEAAGSSPESDRREAARPVLPAEPAPAPPEGFAWANPGAPLGERANLLVRGVDGVRFYRLAEGVYLPEGYVPEDPNDTGHGGWPRRVVRDGVVFVRISGGRFQLGIDAASPGRPAPWVCLDDYYLQVNEVSNREIDAFRKRRISAPTTGWRDWEDAYKRLTDALGPRAADCPAVCIDRAIAAEYARSVGGRLPTEAEWEFAARSRGKDNLLWSTPGPLRAGSPPRAHLHQSDGSNTVDHPVPSGTFRRPAGDDETDQGVVDLTGNVAEWCLDVFREAGPPEAASATTPEACLRNPRATVPQRSDEARKSVVRGGSFRVSAEEAGLVQRHGIEDGERLDDLGFRVVIECPRGIMTKASAVASRSVDR